jgi:hypothetical protein
MLPRQLTISLMGLLALTISGCKQTPPAATPAELVRQEFDRFCPPSVATDAREFQVRGKRQLSDSVIVLYNSVCASSDRLVTPSRRFACRVLKRDGNGWRLTNGGGGTANNTVPPKEALVQYVISTPTGDNGNRSAIVCGQVLSPKVAAIEATFDNKQTLRDTTADGVFGLLLPGASSVSQVRILGANNQILRRDKQSQPSTKSKGN